MFHGTFTTKLLVEEDHEGRRMTFSLLPGGTSVVNRFQGEWKIDPHPSDPNASSISTLEQDIGLAVWIPPPLNGILKKISARQVKRIVEDLQAEAVKINSGRPTLCPYTDVADKEIGEEKVDEDDEEGGDGGEAVQTSVEKT